MFSNGSDWYHYQGANGAPTSVVRHRIKRHSYLQSVTSEPTVCVCVCAGGLSAMHCNTLIVFTESGHWWIKEGMLCILFKMFQICELMSFDSIPYQCKFFHYLNTCILIVRNLGTYLSNVCFDITKIRFKWILISLHSCINIQILTLITRIGLQEPP